MALLKAIRTVEFCIFDSISVAVACSMASLVCITWCRWPACYTMLHHGHLLPCSGWTNVPGSGVVLHYCPTHWFFAQWCSVPDTKMAAPKFKLGYSVWYHSSVCGAFCILFIHCLVKKSNYFFFLFKYTGIQIKQVFHLKVPGLNKLKR